MWKKGKEKRGKWKKEGVEKRKEMHGKRKENEDILELDVRINGTSLTGSLKVIRKKKVVKKIIQKR